MTRFPAPLLERNQKVWLQDKDSKRWSIKGRIRECRPHGKSYIVETESGSLFLRNRKWLKPRGEERDVEEKQVEQEEEEVKQKEVKQKGVKQKEVKQAEKKEEVMEKKRSYAEVAAGQSAHSRPAQDSKAGGSSDRQLRASTSAKTKDSLDRKASRH